MLNQPPITSLAQLLPTSGAGTDSPPPPTMERTLAATMARFATLWDEFLAARGSFAPFMDHYLELWLHSYVPPRLPVLRSAEACTLTHTPSRHLQRPARDAADGDTTAARAHRRRPSRAS